MFVSQPVATPIKLSPSQSAKPGSHAAKEHSPWGEQAAVAWGTLQGSHEAVPQPVWGSVADTHWPLQIFSQLPPAPPRFGVPPPPACVAPPLPSPLVEPPQPLINIPTRAATRRIALDYCFGWPGRDPSSPCLLCSPSRAAARATMEIPAAAVAEEEPSGTGGSAGASDGSAGSGGSCLEPTVVTEVAGASFPTPGQYQGGTAYFAGHELDGVCSGPLRHRPDELRPGSMTSSGFHSQNPEKK